jgi:sulfate/thiosulfate transport system permease protein
MAEIARTPAVSAASLQVPWGTWGLRFAAISYLGLMVAVPIIVVVIKGFEDGLDIFYQNITNKTAMASLRLTIQTALVMTLINTIMGTLTAYVLVKFRFPGKALFNMLIDLPFAIPTLVTGVMLVLLYGPQTQIGKYIEDETGYRILFAPPGIVLALLFVSYPFVVRTVQPVLLSMESNQEEAALSLGASSWGTFWRVIFPTIMPSIVTGSLLSFARALGEFGSIVIVSGNIPMRSQTATTYIYTQVESGDMAAASGISVVLIGLALVITLFAEIFIINRRRNHA